MITIWNYYFLFLNILFIARFAECKILTFWIIDKKVKENFFKKRRLKIQNIILDIWEFEDEKPSSVYSNDQIIYKIFIHLCTL